jgi:quinol monooxygenase YgiN
MNEPFIFISVHTVKEGRLDALRELTARFVDFIADNEPRTLGLHAYLDETGTQLTMVQIHADADAMDAHLEIAGDMIRQAFELVDNHSVRVYGNPGAGARALLEHLTQASVDVRVSPELLGGFARFALA